MCGCNSPGTCRVTENLLMKLLGHRSWVTLLALLAATGRMVTIKRPNWRAVPKNWNALRIQWEYSARCQRRRNVCSLGLCGYCGAWRVFASAIESPQNQSHSPGFSHTWSHVLSERTKTAPIREMTIESLDRPRDNGSLKRRST